MVNEVNKIAADVLAREHALHLPGVGSLVVERCPAERITSRRMRRAYLAVAFTSQQRGVSLVARIAAVADIDVTRAQDIYDRWLAKCGDGTTLAIDGIGRLDRKSFIVDGSFDRLLNPAGRGEVAVGRYSRHIFGAVVSGICIAVLAVTSGIGLYYTGLGDIVSDLGEMFRRPERHDVKTEVVADNTPADAGEPADAAAEPDAGTVAAAEEPAAESVAEGQTASESAAPAAQPAVKSAENPAGKPAAAQPVQPAKSVQPVQQSSAARPDKPVSQPAQPAQPAQSVQPAQPSATSVETPSADAVGRLTSGCSYVVLGVYSTPENALRAVADARKRGAEDSAAFVYGPKYLVALYFDMERERCAGYARSATQFSDLWIYTAR